MRAARLSGPGWAARSGYVELILVKIWRRRFTSRATGKKNPGKHSWLQNPFIGAARSLLAHGELAHGARRDCLLTPLVMNKE